MDVREKLVELLKANFYDEYEFEEIADQLIANGVTFATDTNVGNKWIPVTERLPEDSGMYIVTANDGHAHRVTFVIWQKRNKIWNLTGARSYWRVTHWMPLPEPPEEE